MNIINFQKEDYLDPKEFIDILVRSTLAERRPVNDFARIEKMCQNANLIITARDNGKLIGVSRALTDFSYCTYLSDLAVDIEYQKKGIGKRLIAETKKHAMLTTVILLSAPKAIPYYPKIGMKQFEHCYRLENLEELK